MKNKSLQSFPEWASWLHENLLKGCDQSTLISTLIDNQFDIDSIKQEIALFNYGGIRKREISNIQLPNTDFYASQKLFLAQEDNGYAVLKANSKKLELYIIDNFLSAEECNAVIKLGEKKLRPSSVTIDSGDNGYRTSRTCDLGLLENPFMKNIDEKISKALGIPNNYSEVTQLQKYEVGQQFKQHTDYFEPNSDEYRQHASRFGNRTWTFMVYLNTVSDGGGTHFYGLNHTFSAKQGQAVVWNNRLPSGNVNPETLHAGLPVKQGVKFVITKWFRERTTNCLMS